MKYLIIFNSKYWDRSVEALFKELKEKTNINITSLRMPEDFRKLIHSEKNISYGAIILAGDFTSWPNNKIDNFEISEYLKMFFLQSKTPRVWVLISDLHHHIDDLLNGRKTSDISLTTSYLSEEFESKKYFDMLAWPYEYIEDVSNKFDLTTEIFAEDRQLHLNKLAVALTTHSKLISAFPNRMDFYHCVSLSEFNLVPKIFSRFKLMKFFVPGRRYPTRSQIELQLVNLKLINSYQKFFYSLIEVLTNKSILLMSRVFASDDKIKGFKNSIRFFKHVFFISIGKFIWVDGSYANYPVRKFFEIPLCNSLTVTLPNRFLDALGFKNGINCFIVDLENQTLDQFGFYRLDFRRYILMKNLAKEIVLANHQPANRINQLLFFIDNYRCHSITRGFFDNNTFVISNSIK